MLRALLHANFGSGEIEILTVSQNSWTAEYISESLTISIISNTSWSITNLPDWLTASQTSGTGNQDITITATKNGNTERSCTFQISSNSITLDIIVTQDASVTTEVNTTEKGAPETTVDKETGETIKVEYTETVTYDNEVTRIDVTPFAGDFRITLKGNFPAQASNFWGALTEYTLLYVMDNNNHGINIACYGGYWYLYYNTTASLIASNRIAISSRYGAMTSVIVTYQNGNLSVVANGTTVYDKATAFDVDNAVIYLGGNDNTAENYNKTVTIDEFTYERL